MGRTRSAERAHPLALKTLRVAGATEREVPGASCAKPWRSPGWKGSACRAVLRFGQAARRAGGPSCVRELVEGQSLARAHRRDGAEPARCLERHRVRRRSTDGASSRVASSRRRQPANIIVGRRRAGDARRSGARRAVEGAGHAARGAHAALCAHPSCIAGAKLSVRAEIFATRRDAWASCSSRRGSRLPAERSSAALEKVVSRATAKDPSARFRAQTSWRWSCGA